MHIGDGITEVMTVMTQVLLLPLHSDMWDVCEFEQGAPVVWKGQWSPCHRALR